VTYGLAADLARVIKGMTVRTKSQKVRNLISASLAHMDDMVMLKDMHRKDHGAPRISAPITCLHQKVVLLGERKRLAFRTNLRFS
jgi:hypothetical protein